MHFCVLRRNSQCGHKKWWENHFWQKVSDNSTHTLRVKNFVEINLSRTVSEINTFFHFHHCKIQKIAITHLAIEKIVITHSLYAMEPQTMSHLLAKNKIAKQHILGKYCNCNSFRVTKALLNNQNFNFNTF